jgi:hypothetical protein
MPLLLEQCLHPRVRRGGDPVSHYVNSSPGHGLATLLMLRCISLGPRPLPVMCYLSGYAILIWSVGLGPGEGRSWCCSCATCAIIFAICWYLHQRIANVTVPRVSIQSSGRCSP